MAFERFESRRRLRWNLSRSTWQKRKVDGSMTHKRA
jgi:hypothetical protein